MEAKTRLANALDRLSRVLTYLPSHSILLSSELQHVSGNSVQSSTRRPSCSDGGGKRRRDYQMSVGKKALMDGAVTIQSCPRTHAKEAAVVGC